MKLWINHEHKIHFTYDPKTYNGQNFGFVVGSIMAAIAATVLTILVVKSIKKVKRILNEGKDEDESCKTE